METRKQGQGKRERHLLVLTQPKVPSRVRSIMIIPQINRRETNIARWQERLKLVCNRAFTPNRKELTPLYQHEREMRRESDIRKAMALNELVRILKTEPCKVEAYARWLEKWTGEE